MSISREAFIKGDFTSKSESNDYKNHKILKFLLANPKAYKSNEIGKATHMTDSGARHMLRILQKARLIQHKSPYFIAVIHPRRKK